MFVVVIIALLSLCLTIRNKKEKEKNNKWWRCYVGIFQIALTLFVPSIRETQLIVWKETFILKAIPLDTTQPDKDHVDQSDHNSRWRWWRIFCRGESHSKWSYFLGLLRVFHLRLAICCRTKNWLSTCEWSYLCTAAVSSACQRPSTTLHRLWGTKRELGLSRRQLFIRKYLSQSEKPFSMHLLDLLDRLLSLSTKTHVRTSWTNWSHDLLEPFGLFVLLLWLWNLHRQSEIRANQSTTEQRFSVDLPTMTAVATFIW